MFVGSRLKGYGLGTSTEALRPRHSYQRAQGALGTHAFREGTKVRALTNAGTKFRTLRAVDDKDYLKWMVLTISGRFHPANTVNLKEVVQESPTGGIDAHHPGLTRSDAA